MNEYYKLDSEGESKFAHKLENNENVLIHCGELHFKAVSDDTKFDWVNGYEDFVNKFGVVDCSNKEDL